MLKTRCFILLVYMVLCIPNLYSQVLPQQLELSRTEMKIDFRVGSAIIDSTYMNNANTLRQMVSWIDQVSQDSLLNIVSVEFCGAASPEGSSTINRRLSRERLAVLEHHVRSQIDIPEIIITRNDNYISWQQLYDMISKSDIADKDPILNIIHASPTTDDSGVDSRISQLKSLNGGRTWDLLYSRFFIHMRNAYTVLVTSKSKLAIEYENKLIEEQQEVQDTQPEQENTPAPELTLEPEVTSEPITEEVARHIHIKTNALAWALFVSNIGIEIDMGGKFSFALPVYYSAWDYATSTIKFRTLAAQPELRFWPTGNDKGLFVGAHFGLAYYDLAFDGIYRYQDHNANTPAIGGGMSIGYRTHISKNKKWNIELLVGAGVHNLHYDLFYNVNNGRLFNTNKKTYWGVDNAAVNISYSLDLKKRKK